MTFETIALEELTAVPNRMIAALKSCFTQQDVDFLLSFKRGEPDWRLAPEMRIQGFACRAVEIAQYSSDASDKTR